MIKKNIINQKKTKTTETTIKSPIKWTGGKNKEIKYFKSFIPHNFDTYIEPFFGGGALYWNLSPHNAIINDINPHLINFFLVLRDEYNLLCEKLNTYKHNKDYFNMLVQKLNNHEYEDKIEQAAIFYYLNKTSFSGKWRINKKGM